MPILILLAFLCIPIAEIAVFIKAGQIIGLGWTLVVVVLTAVIGTALLRRQGLKVLSQTQQKLDRGELPVGELFDGICLLIAGALLLTPGFITDFVGLALFIPPVRLLLGTFILSRFLKSGNSRVWVNGQEVGPDGKAGGGRGPRGGRGPIIDGDYTDVTEAEDDEPDRLDHRPDDARGSNSGDSPWRRSG
jgi:UPF0716 protein FxsA